MRIVVYEGLSLASFIVSVACIAIICSFDGTITYITLVLPACLGVPLMLLECFPGADTSAKHLLPNGYSKERLILFADGVYAVAITLIAIDLRYSTSDNHAWEVS